MMKNLTEVLKNILLDYSGKGIGCWMFPLFDDEHQSYAVLGIEYPKRSEYASTVLFARVEGNTIIIEGDDTNKPLVNRLMNAGIPRKQIILAYQGEPVPDLMEEGVS